MIQENEAVKLEDGTILAKHKVEIYCPHCGRDVDEAELAAQLCNDCGTSLAQPKQSVAITVIPHAIRPQSIAAEKHRFTYTMVFD